ncbi:MAG: carboxymuconolactone decarboxylase family protein [Spongiibacteraceae bacterium]
MIDTIEQRQQSILGQPPRILPKHSAEIIKAAQEHTAKLRGGSAQSTAPVAIADIPEMVVTLLGCDADLYERMAAVSVQLLAKSTLPKRDFELVVLRTDWLCQSPYNWGEHVRIAKKFGITSAEIESITQGSTAANWSEHERALLKAAEELHEDAMLSDATWSVLAKTFSEKQLFELIVLIGQFTLVTYVQNSLRLRLSTGNEGLSAR